MYPSAWVRETRGERGEAPHSLPSPRQSDRQTNRLSCNLLDTLYISGVARHGTPTTYLLVASMYLHCKKKRDVKSIKFCEVGTPAMLRGCAGLPNCTSQGASVVLAPAEL